VVWVDLAAIVMFAVFLTAGVLLRQRAEWHKRLMLVATISIVSPAMSRMWRLVPGLSGLSSTSLLSTSLTLGALVLLLSSLALYDMLSRKRVHPATLVGGLSFLAVRAFAGVFADSPMARSFVRGLE